MKNDLNYRKRTKKKEREKKRRNEKKHDSDRSILMYPSTRTEIKSIIGGLKNDAASGLDDCSSKMLRNLSDDLSPFLVRAINKSMKDGQFPTSFKAASIVAIHKSEKKNLTQATTGPSQSYRISPRF
jgi:hypothetical protein